MDFGIKGKTIVVTGGSGGIGRSIVKALLEQGGRVAIIGASRSALDVVFEQLSYLGILKCYQADLCQVEKMGLLVQRIRKDFGEIDILIQSAGIMQGKPAIELTPKEWDDMMAVNARGMFFFMREVVAQSMQNHGGAIVNIASMAGIRGMHPPMCGAHYAASKGAVIAMTMQAAVEWANLGIRCNAVVPGGVLTGPIVDRGVTAEMVKNVPLEKLSRPEDIANGVGFLCSEAAAMITGQSLVIDGGSSVVGY